MAEPFKLTPIDHNKPRANPLGLKNPPKTPEEVVQEYRESKGKPPEQMFPEAPSGVHQEQGYSKNEIAQRAMPSYLHQQLVNEGGYMPDPKTRDNANKKIRIQQEKDSENMGGSHWSKEDIAKVEEARNSDLRSLDKSHDLIGDEGSRQEIFGRALKGQSSRVNQQSHDSHRAGNAPGWEPSTGPKKMVGDSSGPILESMGNSSIKHAPYANAAKQTPFAERALTYLLGKPGQNRPDKGAPPPSPSPSPSPSPAPTPTEKPEGPKRPGPTPEQYEEQQEARRERERLRPKFVTDPVTGIVKQLPIEKKKPVDNTPPPKYPVSKDLGPHSVQGFGDTNPYKYGPRILKPENPKRPQNAAPTPSPEANSDPLGIGNIPAMPQGGFSGAVGPGATALDPVGGKTVVGRTGLGFGTGPIGMGIAALAVGAQVIPHIWNAFRGPKTTPPIKPNPTKPDPNPYVPPVPTKPNPYKPVPKDPNPFKEPDPTDPNPFQPPDTEPVIPDGQPDPKPEPPPKEDEQDRIKREKKEKKEREKKEREDKEKEDRKRADPKPEDPEPDRRLDPAPTEEPDWTDLSRDYKPKDEPKPADPEKKPEEETRTDDEPIKPDPPKKEPPKKTEKKEKDKGGSPWALPALMLPQGGVQAFPSLITGIPTHSAPSFEKTHLEINYYTELGF